MHSDGNKTNSEPAEKIDRWEVSPDAAPPTPMNEEELGALKMDVWALGQKEPILLDAQGRILDGRKRLRICLEIGVEPNFAGSKRAVMDAATAGQETLDGDEAAPFALLLSLLRNHGGTWGFGDTRGRVCNALGSVAAANAMLNAARKAGVVSFPHEPACDSLVVLDGGLR